MPWVLCAPLRRSDREASAERDLNSSRISPRIAFILIAAFLGTLALGALPRRAAFPTHVSAPAIDATDPNIAWNWKSWLDSAHYRLIEKELDERSALTGSVRPWAQYLLSGYLHAGNEKVVIGRSGALLYRPDIAFLLRPDVPKTKISNSESALLELNRFLASIECRLIVMPIPSRAGIEPDSLGAPPGTNVVENQYPNENSGKA